MKPKEKHNHTDRLFQTGLAQLSVAPAADSWAVLQHRMQAPQKKNIRFIKIAAAIILTLSASAILLQRRTVQDNPHELTSMMSVNIHRQFIASAAVSTTQQNPKVADKRSTAPASKKQPQPPHIPTKKKPLDIHTVAAMRPLALNHPTVNRKAALLPSTTDKTAALHIKITYLASTEQKQSSIIKILQAAQRIAPGALLADIRDAKTQLIQRN